MQVRIREDTTVAFVPVVWRYDEPRVADLRRLDFKRLGSNCNGGVTYVGGSTWVVRFDLLRYR